MDTYLRARFTLLVIVTGEEERVVKSLRALCERTRRSCLSWDLADGFQVVSPFLLACLRLAIR
jgi:hypothetical protein